MENRADEIKRLQGCINDLISVLALPALWRGQKPSQMVRTLLDGLAGMLRLDFVYARISEAIDGEPIELIRLAERRHTEVQPLEVGRALDRWLTGDPPASPLIVPNLVGEGEVSITSLRLGLQDETGVLVAGCQGRDFPTKIEMLLLRVAANQAAMWLQEARLSSERTRAAEMLEQRVAERAAQLIAVNEELKKEITERKRAEEELREANERSEVVLDSMTDMFFAIDNEWRYRHFNKHAEDQLRTLGKNPASLIGKVLWDEFPNPDSEEELRRAMCERTVTTHEQYYPPLGEWYENRIYPTPDGGLVIFQRYVTERKRAEDELRRSEASLAEGQRISHTGSWTWNISTEDLYWSQEHFRICGLDPEKEKPVYPAMQWVHPEDRAFVHSAFEKAIREGCDFELDCRVVRPDGTIRDVHSLAHPVFNGAGDLTEYVGTIIDTTERKMAEEALRRAQSELAHVSRVTTMGEMTASIAHEVNQPLAAIVTNGQTCLRLLARDAPDLAGTREALEAIIGDGLRAAEVIKRIRALMKKTVPEKLSLNINETIREVIALVANEMTRNQVSLRTDLRDNLPAVLGDRVQLQQVLLNLILNANEAMGGAEWQPRELLISSQESKPGELMVTVRDSGTGLDSQTAEHIFDAFFTTKINKGGLGLGLSISRTIIEAHGGSLWATPNKDRGVSLRFTLPATV
jgi:PAS domain S-box-containing protein